MLTFILYSLLMIKIDYETFNENLLLTQTYCELQLKDESKNPATALRTINPEYNGKPIFSFKYNSYFETVWQIDPFRTGNPNLYGKLFETQLAEKRRTISPAQRERNFEGKILIAGVDETVTDGASEEISQGFIDIYDCPPIDTWFHISNNDNGRVIFAWIPEQFVNLVNLGREGNCVDCFYWYDKDSSEMRDWKEDYVPTPNFCRNPEPQNEPFFVKLKRLFKFNVIK